MKKQHHAKGDPHTHSDQDRMHEAISAKKYQKLKRDLREMEITNYDSIIFIPCSGNKGWMEFAEHSALFFYYGAVKKLRLNYKFMDDTTSFYNQYDIGYIHTLSIETIRTHLKRVGLYKSEEKRSYFTIIKLTRSYTREEIKTLIRTENARRLANLAVKDAVNLDPRLHQVLASLATRLHTLCNNHLDKLSSHTRGVEIVNFIDDTLATYHQITMLKNVQKSKIIEKLIIMRKNIYQLIVVIKVIGDAKLWDLDVCISIQEPLVTAKKYIEQDIKQLLKYIKKEATDD